MHIGVKNYLVQIIYDILYIDYTFKIVISAFWINIYFIKLYTFSECFQN